MKGQSILSAKKQRKIQNIIMTPLTIAWMLCLFIEFYESLNPSSLPGFVRTLVWIFLGCGIFVTLIIIVWLCKKIDNTADNIISEIDDRQQ